MGTVLCCCSQLLYKRYGGNILVQLLGRWQEHNGQMRPDGGLVYYISPPTSLGDLAANPIHALFYIAFMLSACALFSKTWIEVSGSSAHDVAKQLRDSQMFLQVLAHFSLSLSPSLPTSKAHSPQTMCGLLPCIVTSRYRWAHRVAFACTHPQTCMAYSRSMSCKLLTGRSRQLPPGMLPCE